MTNERERGMYKGGTPEAIKFIEKYKETGHIVDFYSDEFIGSFDQDCSPTITLDTLKYYDSEYGTSYRGHMLTIFIGDENNEMLEELSQLYLPFNQILNLTSEFGSWTHKPDFFIVNLITKEILCVGLGRKNRMFQFELHKYLKSQINPSRYGQINTDCSDDFFAIDHNEIAKTTIRETESLGDSYFSINHLAGNADVSVTLNKKDGLYYFDDFDEEGMTEEEVNDLRKDYDRYREWILDSAERLEEFFPLMNGYEWELNTGDY